MTREPPYILVVGSGAVGGIGRFERNLMAALDDLSQRGIVRVDSVWRGHHPAYLQISADERAPERSSAFGTRKPIFAARIAHAVIHGHPDLVVFSHVNLARIAWLARASGARYVVWTHGIEVWSPLSKPRRSALLRAAGVVAVSEYTADELERHQGLPRNWVRVIPHAIEPRWLETAIDLRTSGDRSPAREHTPRLLSVSRLDPSNRDKGIDAVIRALPTVLATVPTVTYHIVGDGKDRDYLTQLAVECGVADATVFRGAVSHAELTSEYRRSDVFVLPSGIEGFGLVFIEAMAYAKPIIARRAGAAAEVGVDGRTGILVDDDRGLAPAMISLLCDSNRAREMGLAGLGRVMETYSFEAFRSRIEAALLAAVS